MTNESTEAAITVEGLTKRYGELVAVDDLSFSVRSGSVTGFLGPNGAGKTTALKAIVGIARPTAGRALINGTPVEAAHPDARVLGVYIEPTGAHPGRSARNHLRSLAALAGLPAGRVDEVLGTSGSRRRPTAAWGRTRRACASGSGSRRPCSATRTILVLDEPLNGLDPQGIRWLRTFLRERAAAGGTVLLSSHVLTEAAQTVDDVVVIHKGRLVYRRRDRRADAARRGRRGRAHADARAARRRRAPRRRAGAASERRRRVLIEGMDAAQVGELAHGERVILHELVVRGRLARAGVLQPDRGSGGGMTTLIRGELIKATTTRTIFAYAAMAVVLAVGQVLVTILPASSDLMSLADKKEALAGLPLAAAAARDRRGRRRVPAPDGRAGRRSSPAATEGSCSSRARAPTPSRAWPSPRWQRSITLAVGLPLLAGESGTALAAGDVALVAGGSLLAAALSAIFGVALGALVRNQVAAVTGTLVVIFVVLPLVQALSPTALDLTPFGAAQGVAGSTLATLSMGRGGRGRSSAGRCWR